jgi:hypothetical protein
MLEATCIGSRCVQSHANLSRRPCHRSALLNQQADSTADKSSLIMFRDVFFRLDFNHFQLNLIQLNAGKKVCDFSRSRVLGI